MSDQHTAAAGQLLLVTYYVDTRQGASDLVAAFEQAVGRRFAGVLVVDNSQRIEPGSEGRTTFLRGSNSFQEFSGWLEGLEAFAAIPAAAQMPITLINDSYLRNWTISAASRPIIAAMYGAAARNKIAGWLDNFSHLGKPRFARRPNSRIVVAGPGRAGEFVASLSDAMARCAALEQAGQPLFDTATAARLQAWIDAQQGRWSDDALASRFRRIFVEHHLFDGVPPSHLALKPATYIGSLVYALARRLTREAR